MNYAAPDTIYHILLNSDIEDIAKYCQSNRHARDICNNDRFWPDKGNSGD